jgi:hypothetical protein
MRVALQLAAIVLLSSAAHAQVRTGSTMEASTQTAASSKGLTELDAARSRGPGGMGADG